MIILISVLSVLVRGSFAFGGFYPTYADVIELDEENFQRQVINSEEVWIVEFYWDGCPHCREFLPEYQKAAKALMGVVKLGASNEGAHKVLAAQYGVTEVPTMIIFGANKNKPVVFHGERTAKSIVDIAMKTVKDKVYDRLLGQSSGEGGNSAGKGRPNNVIELTDSNFEKVCKEHPICIIAVLPHILDCQSDCRNEYLKMLTSLRDKYKESKWGWAWSEAMAHPDLETALDIGGFGYPALAALNANKMQFALQRGSFSNDGVNDFLRHIAVGRGHTSPLRGAKLPELSKIKPWDGRDGALPKEEDYDLPDVDLDGLVEEYEPPKDKYQIQMPIHMPDDLDEDNEPPSDKYQIQMPIQMPDDQIELPYPYNNL